MAARETQAKLVHEPILELPGVESTEERDEGRELGVQGGTQAD